MSDTSIKKTFVSNSQESSRMFEHDWQEVLSKVHFTIPLVLYLPIVGTCLWFAPAKWVSAGLFLGGLFCWTFVEYVLHRFLFHWTPPGRIGARLHFIFHGVHHDYPNDRLRLVLPPAISIPLATLFYVIFYLLLGKPAVFPFYAGFLIGYLCYDMMHYSMHHLNWKNPLWQRIKQHHMLHHYQQPERGFGVSNPLWDYVFNTTFRFKK
ncbi:MAG: sterol desaturase family protein [Saprospiraceae bacterium]|jgi:sterol desaturase/sphingolipid hydroxylase (fatty acid hydroxylase superfamily)|nr:sterol desaturase family protein [Saprospiraceae bacterium]